MAQSKQDAAIVAAQQVVSFAVRMQSLLREIEDWKARSDHVGYPTLWQSFPTSPWLADGTISGTPDPNPVLTNPITLGGINRSQNDLLGQVYLMSDFVAFMSNSAVTTADRTGPLDNLVG